VIGFVAIIAYLIDPYGVLRNSSGRKLAIYFSPRKAKFFMSKRYVPSNFDGLVVGASGSGNWDVPFLAGARIYNESLDGANAAEERIVVNQALPKGHYKVAVFLLSPAMTRNHEIRDGLYTSKITETVGSIHLFIHEAAFLLIAAHLRSVKVYATTDGQFIWNKPRRLKPTHLEPTFFQIDPIALEDFRVLVRSLQQRGAAIVYVIPPFYEPCYELDKNSLDAYRAKIRPLLPAAPIIDFDAPEYTYLRSDPNNFFDCDHVGPEGSAKVSALLDSLVPTAIKAGK
jgi:hypothetical protein